MIEGVLFDMDGVLLDSEAYICRAAIKMFAEKGLEVQPDDFLPFVGAGENRYIGGVAKKYDLPLNIETAKTRTYQIYDNITRGKLEALKGVREFIAKCRSKDLKLAVATSADYSKMVINLREIKLPVSTFDATVNGLDVEHKKPAPDIYLKAAELLALEAQNCLVVEDAVNGVEAAKAAGCRCLALTTSFSEKELAKADWIAPNLSEAPDEALCW